MNEFNKGEVKIELVWEVSAGPLLKRNGEGLPTYISYDGRM